MIQQLHVAVDDVEPGDELAAVIGHEDHRGLRLQGEIREINHLDRRVGDGSCRWHTLLVFEPGNRYHTAYGPLRGDRSLWVRRKVHAAYGSGA